MDGLVALREAHGFAADEVAEVNVRYPASHNANLMYTDPQDGPQAKFSLEYALAVLLLSGNCTLGDFDGDAPMRPAVRALYPRIRRHPVDKSEGEFPTQVEVLLTDGRRCETAVAMPAGSIAAPFTPAQYQAKFDGCVAAILDPAATDQLRAALSALPNLRHISELTAPLRAPFALARQDQP